jgi:SPP1 gp7 family putative phage head morphogenesis protein
MAYWQDRETDALNKVSNKTIAETEKQLSKYYSNLMMRTLDDFEAIYSKILLAKEEGKEPTPADLYKLDTYWKHQAQLRKELNELGEKQIALLSKQFEKSFVNVYKAVGIVGEAAFSTLDKPMVQQMINSVWCADGKSWSQRVWKNTELLAQTLNEELIHCVASGKKPSELKKLLQSRFEVSYQNADMLVRTEIAHIQTQAAIKRYEDAGVLEVQVWASKDERRCEHCGKLHKQKFLISEHIPIPAHPNCRCNVIPVVETII